MSDALSAKREELRRKKEHWFAQRMAAQERERLETEGIDGLSLSVSETSHSSVDAQQENTTLVQHSFSGTERRPIDSGSQQRINKSAVLPSDEQVLDRITERITTRLREEVRSEVMPFISSHSIFSKLNSKENRTDFKRCGRRIAEKRKSTQEIGGLLGLGT
jgi:hypothetical protein